MLITSRTPLRVSFFGGGTDYPEFFERSPGAVVGMAIDKYIYISALKLVDFVEYKYRVSYRTVETVQTAEDIQHPVVRSALAHYGVKESLDISIMSNLPANSGLGSSSAFTVGFVNLLAALRREALTRLDLGLAAIHIERNLLGENVGVQDQLHAAFGGINRFDFINSRIRISPIQMGSECQRHFLRSLVLIFTGLRRSASDVLQAQMRSTREASIDRQLGHLLSLANQAVGVLEGLDPERLVADFGAMMHDGWMTKRQLSASVTNEKIDSLYNRAVSAGAIGGKLCGAGAGGFLLMVVPPERRPSFCEAMAGETLVDIGLDTSGSTILDT